MPAPADVVFVVALVIVASIVEHYWFFPRFRADVAAGVVGARVRGYARAILGQALFAATALWIWVAHGRSAAALRLAAPTGWRLWLGVAIVGLMVALVVVQLRSVMRLSAERRVAARPKLGNVTFLLPHSHREHQWFLLLSLTAGVCEELLYRGYLTWFLTPWTGTTGAFVGVVLLFGIGHLYQGKKGAIRATAAGAVMSLIVISTGWLIPAMIVHALVDAGSGTVGYWLLRDTR